MFDKLDEDIQKLEELIRKHEREYREHPQMLGYIEKFYNHKEVAEVCIRIAGYLKELKKHIAEENNEIHIQD